MCLSRVPWSHISYGLTVTVVTVPVPRSSNGFAREPPVHVKFGQAGFKQHTCSAARVTYLSFILCPWR